MADQVQELEQAILARANRLATEYNQRAQRSRDNILREAQEKLHLREEREVLVAKAKAERNFRRKVQANELKFRKEMDLLRWNLVQGVLERLQDKMEEIAENEDLYFSLLRNLLAHSASQFEEKDLIAKVNAKDLPRLQGTWPEFSKQAAPDKTILLCSTPIDTIGGILVQTEDERVRLNNTFEGRMERLSGRLYQAIIERLLPPSHQQENSFSG